MKKQKCSTFREIARVLIKSYIKNPMTWLYWPDVIEALIPGFGSLTDKEQYRVIKRYRGRLSDARKLLNDGGYFLMADGSIKTRKFKLLTNHPDDIARAEAMIEHSESLNAVEKDRLKRRIAIIAKTKKLPPHERKKREPHSRAVTASAEIQHGA